MLSVAAEAGAAGRHVGYPSSTQLRREYRRCSGDAPNEDLAGRCSLRPDARRESSNSAEQPFQIRFGPARYFEHQEFRQLIAVYPLDLAFEPGQLAFARFHHQQELLRRFDFTLPAVN